MNAKLIWFDTALHETMSGFGGKLANPLNIHSDNGSDYHASTLYSPFVREPSWQLSLWITILISAALSASHLTSFWQKQLSFYIDLTRNFPSQQQNESGERKKHSERFKWTIMKLNLQDGVFYCWKYTFLWSSFHVRLISATNARSAFRFWVWSDGAKWFAKSLLSTWHVGVWSLIFMYAQATSSNGQ